MTAPSSPTEPSTGASSTGASTAGPPRWLRPLLEFGPVLAFLVTQRLTKDADPHGLDGLWWATIVLMATLTVSLTVSRRLEGRWPTVPLITLVFALVMGGLTLWLKSDQFIKQKPTFVNLLFAAILGFGFLRGRYFVKAVLGEAIHLTDAGWRAITLRLIPWFLFLSALNEVAWRTLSTDRWTDLKSIGLPILTMVFFLTLSPLFERHLVRPQEPAEGTET